jgi:hypothetical protein
MFSGRQELAGLVEHKVRWLIWRCWTLLAMLAHALAADIAATERAEHPPPGELIGLTCNDPSPVHQPDHRNHPSAHQSRWPGHAGDAATNPARASHYRRQQAQLT